MSTVKNHLCRECGETNPDEFYGKKRTLCKDCHNKYTIEKGKRNRAYAIRELGGECVICGYSKYTEALDIHHVNPLLKDPNFNAFNYWSRKRIDKELKNCVLLCSNCHRAEHSGYIKEDLTQYL